MPDVIVEFAEYVHLDEVVAVIEVIEILIPGPDGPKGDPGGIGPPGPPGPNIITINSTETSGFTANYLLAVSADGKKVAEFDPSSLTVASAIEAGVSVSKSFTEGDLLTSIGNKVAGLARSTFATPSDVTAAVAGHIGGDPHPQYALANGSRAFTGDVSIGSKDAGAKSLRIWNAVEGEYYVISADDKGVNFVGNITANLVSATALMGSLDFKYLTSKPTTLSGYGITDAGTVTSVSGKGTVSGLTLSGTVTTSGSLELGGTLAVTASNFASQTKNTFLSAPNGTDGVPTFRAIVAADVPTLNQDTTGNAATATALQKARTINGVSFDGTANITITADPNSHTHPASDITGLATVATSGKYGDLTEIPTTFTPAAHTQAISTISDATTVGQNFVKLSNPSVIGFVRTNADNTVTHRTPAGVVTDLTDPTTNSGTSITLADSDSGKILRLTGASAVTVEVPSGLASGFNVMLIRETSQTVTINQGSGATLRPASGKTITSQWGVASIIRIAVSEYVVTGGIS